MMFTFVVKMGRSQLPYGFKLLRSFLESPECDDAVKTIKDRFPGKKVLVVTQTNVDARNGIATVRRLTDDLVEQLSIDTVVSLLKEGRQNEVPAIDVLVVNKEKFSDCVVLSFSHIAPIILAESDEDYAFGTLINKYVSRDTFSKIVRAMGTDKKIEWDVPMSTCFPYHRETLPEQIERLTGCNLVINPDDPDIDDDLFSYGEGDEKFGWYNNVYIAGCNC